MRNACKYTWIVSMLSGCGGSDPQTDDGTTAQVSTASTASTASTGEAGSTSPAPTSTGDDDSSGDTGEPATGTTHADATSGTETGEPPATAFWRIERPADSERTWLVAPDGQRVFMLGVNTVMRDKQCDGAAGWITRHAPTKSAQVEWARLGPGQSGPEVSDKPYCFNSVGAFSETNDFDGSGGDSYMIRPVAAGGAGAPYTAVVYINPGGDDRALRDVNGTVLEGGVAGVTIGDPFNPAYIADIEARVAADVTPRRDDPNLQMWFLGNEIGVFDKAKKGEGVRDFRRWIWSDCPQGSSIDTPQCARHALAAMLRDRYANDMAALNAAWESNYPGGDFAVIVDVGPRPVPYVMNCNTQCRVDLQIFVHDHLLRAWVDLLTTRVRAVDPNHLISSPRLAIGARPDYRFWTPASEADPDVWTEDETHAVGTDNDEVKYSPLDLLGRVGDAGFDVVSFNIYDGGPEFEKPWFTDGVHRVTAASGLPVLISEFSVRARIDGWTNKGGAGSFVPNDDATDDQIQRGAYYESQVAQFYGFRDIIGANWHAWSDRYLAADPAHQINMGLVQCDDPQRGFTAGTRWDEVDDRVAATNCNIMALIEAATGL
jgi:hypothetical protein